MRHKRWTQRESHGPYAGDRLFDKFLADYNPEHSKAEPLPIILPREIPVEPLDSVLELDCLGTNDALFSSPCDGLAVGSAFANHIAWYGKELKRIRFHTCSTSSDAYISFRLPYNFWHAVVTSAGI